MASSKPKACALCGKSVTIRYRIQVDQSGQWLLACPDCQEKRSRNNPDYRYGGTWKARKR